MAAHAGSRARDVAIRRRLHIGDAATLLTAAHIGGLSVRRLRKDGAGQSEEKAADHVLHDFFLFKALNKIR